MAKRKPAVDSTWPAEARNLWHNVLNAYELQEHELRLLREACHQLARCVAARKDIAKHGVTVPDRFGVPRENPAVAIERAAANQFRLLCREIGLSGDAATAADDRNRLPRLKSVG